MAADPPPTLNVAHIAGTGEVQVYQLPATQILSAQDGGDVNNGAAQLETLNVQSVAHNRLAEFLDDLFLLQGFTAGTNQGGVFRRNEGGVGNWGKVYDPGIEFNGLSGLYVLHPDGVPTLAFFYWEDVGDELRIVFSSDGANWTTRNLTAGVVTSPASTGIATVYRRALFWPHARYDANGVAISAHDIELNTTTFFTLFDVTHTGAETSLVVHKNKMFALGIADNSAAPTPNGIRYELRRLDGGAFTRIHREADVGGLGQYPGVLLRGHTCMFTDPATGDLIVFLSGGPSSGNTHAAVGSTKVLRFPNADTDPADTDGGIDITAVVLGTVNGGDQYLSGGADSNLNRVWFAVEYKGSVWLWTYRLSTDTKCWQWRGYGDGVTPDDSEIEPVAGLVGIRPNDFAIVNSPEGGGYRVARTGAVELEGIPEEVVGGTKVYFRGRGVSMPGVLTFYASALEQAPDTTVPVAIIAGSLVVGAGLLTALAAYWHFDTDYADASGNGLTLTQNGTVSLVPAVFSNGASFDGNTANYLSRATTTSLKLGQAGQVSAEFAISCWLDINTLAAAHTVCGQSNTTTDGWYVQIGTDGAITWVAQTAITTSSPAASITTGLHHLVISCDRNLLKFYVDNVEVHSVAFVPTANSASEFTVGRRSTVSTPLDAIMDELAIWSRNLVPDEITALYNAGAGKLLTDTTALPTTPTISGNTVIDFVCDEGSTLYSAILNTAGAGIGEGAIGELVADLVE